jgi:hypothetical protein
MTGRVDRLDVACEALRAWCHERPDRADPATVYASFGSITRLLGTLTQVIEELGRTTGRATGSDDGRSLDVAATEIDSLAVRASAMVDDAITSVARAHSIVGHLIFAVDE